MYIKIDKESNILTRLPKSLKIYKADKADKADKVDKVDKGPKSNRIDMCIVCTPIYTEPSRSYYPISFAITSSQKIDLHGTESPNAIVPVDERSFLKTVASMER